VAPDFTQVFKRFEAGDPWLVLDGFSPEQTLELEQAASAHFSRVQWVLFEETRSSDLELAWARQAPECVLVDCLHHATSETVQAGVKALLHRFRDVRFVFLTNGFPELPSYYGKGTYLSGDGLVPLAQAGRADKDLLKHSHRLIPTYTMADLVLGPVTQLKIQEALAFVRTKEQCEELWGFRQRHSRGHSVTILFHGASGTGKTMAAEAMASELGLPLYQVDLSAIVSKYVGETEKNLKTIFKAAEGVKGILLFDEGDALFGSRTDVKSSQDRFANMEVNYLLQEIERFNGVLLLSTNFFNNMDAAFLRRFSYTITFGAPVLVQRKEIWKRNIPASLPLAADVSWDHLARFGLTGGSIKNCIRHAAARAAGFNKTQVGQEDFLWSIKRELQKHDLEIERETVGEQYWRKVAPEWEAHQKK
jgi:adenosyl cobinamide kinase/adenosyl cobinamide phosphate guanylyltransferase